MPIKSRILRSRKSKAPGLDEAVAMAQKIGADQTYLTHISHNLGKYRDIQKELPEGVDLAWDGLKVTL